ncbi:hypothetical protein GJ744_000987 [Endocarpon pusillum]|uniref:Uncharacterized protein n=1 Tax=Endocarpon pusillum TaxID=364733 RepID=A0A8H7ADZ4_9EURO|nr:hypothetical protein GJ744_000987 [Endocarpon pusillum]
MKEGWGHGKLPRITRRGLPNKAGSPEGRHEAQLENEKGSAVPHHNQGGQSREDVWRVRASETPRLHHGRSWQTLKIISHATPLSSLSTCHAAPAGAIGFGEYREQHQGMREKKSCGCSKISPAPDEKKRRAGHLI